MQRNVLSEDGWSSASPPDKPSQRPGRLPPEVRLDRRLVVMVTMATEAAVLETAERERVTVGEVLRHCIAAGLRTDEARDGGDDAA